MDYELRPIVAEEWPAFNELMYEVFGEDVDPDWTERSRQTAELDRSLAAFDGAELVATSGVYSLRMRVPGGVLPTAGVTWVTVRSTHRRRGLLTAMMRRMLEGARERQEPLASLWASESQIYGRYGFGPAGFMGSLKIDPRHARLAVAPPRGTTRLVDLAGAAATIPELYQRATAERPGTLERSRAWWDVRRLADSAGSRAGGWSRKRFAVYSRDGRPEGYAIFKVKGDWGAFPDHKVQVIEAFGTDADASAGIWSYIFDLDLVTEIESYFRPLDDPVPFLLADPRRARYTGGDEIWLRVLDPVAALAARAYLGQGAIRIGLTDAFLPDNSGVYELEVGDGAAACRRVDREPDISLAADGLGALYTGDVSPLQLLAAGRLEEARPGAALAAHRLLHWPVRTFCPEVF